MRTCKYFYPRPPRGGRRGCAVVLSDAVSFLSTPSARRATFDIETRRLDGLISIHALREEGDITFLRLLDFIQISIHALREEGDLSQNFSKYFSSLISIHALREEGDLRSWWC